MGGWQVSVVEELGIPVKFVGVGEGVDDLQPFDPEAFVEAIFSWPFKRAGILIAAFSQCFGGAIWFH